MKKLFLFLTIAVTVAFADQIADGYQGTSDFRIVHEALINTTISAKESDGDIASLRLLMKDKNVYMAVSQDDILKDLVKNNPQLKNKLKIISPMYKALIVIVSRKDSHIDSFKNLSDKRVVVDIPGSGDYYTFLNIQEQKVITPEVFNVKKDMALKYLDSLKADAYFFIGDIKEIKKMYGKYKISPVVASGYQYGKFSINKKNSIDTSYVEKFLLTTNKKEKYISKDNLNLFLSNLLNITDRNYLCGFSSKMPLPFENYIYFACSQNMKSAKGKTNKQRVVSHRMISKKIYYDNLEDIVIYVDALKNRSYNANGTSHIVEKAKFDNAIKLIKREIKNDNSSKIVIINKGSSSEIFDNMKFVYRLLKKAKIPRQNLIKKSIPVNCGQDCFINTTVSFKVL